MAFSHEFIFVSGALFLLAIFAGFASARIGAPLLLVFLVVGMLAGEDGPVGSISMNFEPPTSLAASRWRPSCSRAA